MNSTTKEDELVTEFMEITGTDPENAFDCLSTCDWNLDSAVRTFLEKTTTSFSDEQEEQRAPIPPCEDRLLQQEDMRALSANSQASGKRPRSGFQLVPKQQTSPTKSITALTRRRSVFETVQTVATKPKGQGSAVAVADLNDFWHDSNGSAQKTHELAAKIRPPIDILAHGPLENVKEAAQNASKFILVNVQDIKEFVSHALNRDVWSDHRIRDLIKSHFLLWQVQCTSEEGARFGRLYHIKKFPSISILDSISGECLYQCTVPSLVTPDLCDLILSELQDFIAEEAGGVDHKLKKKTVADLTEEEQLALAIGESLTQKQKKENHQKETEYSDYSEEETEDQEQEEQELNYSSEKKAEEKQAAEILIPPNTKKAKSEEKLEVNNNNSQLSEMCVLQIRQTDGKAIVGTFNSLDTLSVVRTFIDLNRTDNKAIAYNIVTLCPRRVLVEDISLQNLGLSPRSAIIIERKQS